jgi:hypothetical protein
VPILRSFFAIYTDGAKPIDTFDVPAGCEVFFGEMTELVVPGPQDELFGLHASLMQRVKIKRGFLLGISREVKGRSGSFFDQARKVVAQATAGLHGVGLDVLRLWPFPLAGLDDAFPEETLAEDLFSVGFTEMGEHGYRAETFGFAKLGQREVSFEFKGRELLEEGALMCGHLADWLMDNGRRIENGQSMAFGFDRVTFFAAEGASTAGPFRGWHPPLIQKLLPTAIFPGVGVLEIVAQPEGEPVAGQARDLTAVLQRSLEQRLLLEELDLSGDSPHATATARVNGFVKELSNLVVWREEHSESKDSGWRFRTTGHQDNRWGVLPLVDIARKVPEIVRFLALPWGVRLEWSESGKLTIDASRAHHDDDDSADLDD